MKTDVSLIVAIVLVTALGACNAADKSTSKAQNRVSVAAEGEAELSNTPPVAERQTRIPRRSTWSAPASLPQPRIGSVGRGTLYYVAVGPGGYFSAKKFLRLAGADDDEGLRQMSRSGMLVDLEDCHFRVIDVVGGSGRPHESKLCEIRILNGSYEGQTAWKYLGPVELSNVRWERR